MPTVGPTRQGRIGITQLLLAANLLILIYVVFHLKNNQCPPCNCERSEEQKHKLEHQVEQLEKQLQQKQLDQKPDQTGKGGLQDGYEDKQEKEKQLQKLEKQLQEKEKQLEQQEQECEEKKNKEQYDGSTEGGDKCWSSLQKCPQEISTWSQGDQKSQTGQDKELYNKYWKNKCYGTFLEMGALDGSKFSNSWFYEKVLAWRGLCVEPNPLNYKKLLGNRPLCIDVNAAVTKENGMLKFMQVEGYADALSGIVDAYDPRHLERIQEEVKTKGGTMEIVDIRGVTLHDLLAENNIDHVDFFSLDTEGSELMILQGIDWTKVSIDVIMVENNYGDDKVEQFMKTVGYKKDFSIQFDDVFVKK